MHEAKVKEKYNALFGAEQRFKGRKLYPIHKKLDFKNEPYVDIYDWISQHIPFEKEETILDAGCGVGYGSLLIADQNNVSVLGISLSEKEISRAQENKSTYSAKLRIKFELGSYDQQFNQSFDKIIAVESIKHSRDLSYSLHNLKGALTPGGQLIILEDLYQHQDLNSDGQQLLKDYKLVDLYRFSDYYKVLGKENCELIDLSNYVLPKIKWRIESKMIFAQIMNWFSGNKPTNIFSILRGGYHLDRLYYKKAMRYAAIIYTKPQ